MTIDGHDDCRRQIEALRRERDAAELANRELREVLTELELAAGTDRLTGAWTRRRFEEAAAAEMSLARRGRIPVSLLMFDLDHFKNVNDTFGHPAGDKVLAGMAEIVREQLRVSDALVRWGGEEFIVLAPATRIDGGLNLAEKIRRAVASHEFPGTGRVTISLGVAEFRPDMDLEAWVFLADEALYHAKAQGRNRVVAGHGQAALGNPPALLEILWEDVYECGESTIDIQHQQLFRLANALFGATTSHQPAAEVALRLKRLLAHAAQHFHDEEAILEKAGYPGLQGQVAAHRRLLARATNLQQEVEGGIVDLARLVEFLVMDLVQGHLLTEDANFFPCFTASDPMNS